MKTSLMVALAFFATAAAVVAPTANAVHFCNGAGQVIDLAGQAYITADEFAGEEYLFSAWVYAESNGQEGLQRGGVTILGDADSCQDSATPDTGIF